MLLTPNTRLALTLRHANIMQHQLREGKEGVTLKTYERCSATYPAPASFGQ